MMGQSANPEEYHTLYIHPVGYKRLLTEADESLIHECLLQDRKAVGESILTLHEHRKCNSGQHWPLSASFTAPTAQEPLQVALSIVIGLTVFLSRKVVNKTGILIAY